jgi:hypothetical protein
MEQFACAWSSVHGAVCMERYAWSVHGADVHGAKCMEYMEQSSVY